MSLLQEIRTRFASALQELPLDPAPLLEMIRPAQDAKFGDFQANCAMSMTKALGKPPREIATLLISRLRIDDLCEQPEIAGPGFINLRIRDSLIAERITAIAGDSRLGVAKADPPRRYVVDFSSPNVAKPMHVGHLRSTVIGDALCRTLRFAGHHVTSDNHIGDWGTQFGMIIFGYRHFVNAEAYQRDAVTELARLYKLVNQLSDYHAARAKLPQLTENSAALRAKLAELSEQAAPGDKKIQKQKQQLEKQIETADEAVSSAQATVAQVESDSGLKAMADKHPEIARLAREETAKLHAGHIENQKLWDEFLPACLRALQRIYDRLGVSFDLTLGESHYNPMLQNVVNSLKQKGLCATSEGAECVFIEGNRAPFIVKKSDGAFTYATTDLATIQYRAETLSSDTVLYVVDKRQSEHFQLLFETSRLWAYKHLTLEHISFGTVMGKDGKPYKTRSGDTVGLESLIDEAISRARVIVDENDDRRPEPQLTPDERARVAEIVGIGGIKYADLHHNRDSDYVFDWDRMLATTGDTAAYMQYAFARICGIFRKTGFDRNSIQGSGFSVLLTCPEERVLALQLLQFDYAIDSTLSEYRPHILTTWLFETADCFSRFYDRCSVQDAESPEIRTSRLILCDLMARALQTGLSLLGIETAEVM